MKNGPKVAFVASIFGHFRAFHIPFMQWFLDSGWEVYAYANSDGSELILQDMGIHCISLEIRRSPFSWKNISAFRRLCTFFRQEGFELVHVHTPVASVIGRLAASFASVPAVLYTAHGFHFYHGASFMNWMIYYPVERIMARKTDFLITVNNEDYKRALKFPVNENVYLTPGVGVEISAYSSSQLSLTKESIREKLGIESDKCLFLCIAEFNNNKNHLQILDALLELRTKQLRLVQCIFVGRGPLEAKLLAEIEKRNLQSIVHILGYRRDIPELLHAADVVLLMSKREGLPRSLLEAMAAGKPIIATDTRGNRDLVSSGTNGWLVPIGSIRETAKRIEYFIDQPLVIEKMGHQSKIMAEPYRIELALSKMVEIYQIAIQFANDRSRAHEEATI